MLVIFTSYSISLLHVWSTESVQMHHWLSYDRGMFFSFKSRAKSCIIRISSSNTYHFACVSNQRKRIVSCVSIPDLNQPITATTDYLLVIKLTAVNSCESKAKKTVKRYDQGRARIYLRRECTSGIFLRRGCTYMFFFFSRKPVVFESRPVISGGGGECAPPAPSP